MPTASKANSTLEVFYLQYFFIMIDVRLFRALRFQDIKELDCPSSVEMG